MNFQRVILPKIRERPSSRFCLHCQNAATNAATLSPAWSDTFPERAATFSKPARINQTLP